MINRIILVLAAALSMALPAVAMAQPTPGESSLDPFGIYIPNVAIYCANSAGAAIVCPSTSGGSGSNAAAGPVNSAAPSSASSTGYTNGSGNLVPVAPATPLPTGDATADTALGTPADAAWGGTGSGSSIALAKALYGALVANTAVNNSFTTVVSTPTAGGSAVTAGRAIMMACTAAGNVVLNLSGSGSLTYPIVAVPSVAIQPFAVVSIASSGGGTTATCTFADLN